MKSIFRTSRFIVPAIAFLFTTQAKAQLKAAFSSDVASGCSPLLVNFQNDSQGTDDNTDYHWDLGNGSTPSREKNPSALFLNPGTGSVTYTIKLVIKSSVGSDSVIKKNYITVYANPKVSFTANTKQGCPPLNVKFTDATKAGSGTIKSWLWDFGEGELSDKQNPTTTYHYSNTYTVTLSVVNSFGCKQTSDGETSVHVLDTVHAAFDYRLSNICQSPSPVEFSNTSQSATPINSYHWNFGDGQQSAAESPAHTFQNTGTYPVQLISKNTKGCSDTILQNITVKKAGADFTYSNTCANSAVQFTDASSGVPVSSAWDFGDGAVSKEISPKHIYTSPGDYTVTLQANFGSCNGSVTKKITIVNRPDAAFSASSSGVCKLPFTVNFTNKSSGADTYQWLFGDSKTATNKNPSHAYSEAGFFDVMLIATAGNSCSDTSVIKNAVTLGPPVIDSVQNLIGGGCVPQEINPVPFIKTAEPIVSYKWNFGDGGSSKEETPHHTFTKTGAFTVSLVAFTASGCSDTFVTKKPIEIGIAPQANFGADPLNTCARTSVSFTDSTNGTVTNWLWKFGDGGESNLQNTSHHYLDTGWFSVTLIAYNNGCTDTMVRNKYVYIKPPVARYNSSFNCSKPYERTFTDKSIGADTWQWDFGDGTGSSTQNPVHTFPKPGIYLVKLKVTNDECFDTLQVKMQVVDEHPAFTFDSETKASCRNDAVVFTATNINPANISTYNWIYGDNTSSGFVKNKTTINHKYTTAGTFTPQLITKDVLGCTDTVISNLNATVYGPKASFGNDTGICINSTAMFYDFTVTDGTHDIKKREWTYEPNVVQTYTSVVSYQHLYSKAGFYDIKLAVYDSYGCKDSLIKTKAVQVTNPKAVFSVTDSMKCTKNNLSITNASVGEKLRYTWNFGDGTTSSESASAITHSYQKEGVYTISLSVTDKFQCRADSVQKKAITISDPKAVMVINGPVETTCPPLLVKPVSASLNTTSLSWSFGDGSISMLDSPSHNYTQGGSYDLMLVAKGFGECYDTAHQLVKLKGPSGKFSYNPLVHCNPSSVSFVCETRDAVKVTWDFNDGIVEEDNVSHTATHVYKNNGKYLPKLLMTDKDGCFVGLENLDTIFISGAKADYIATSQASCDSSLAVFVQTTVPYYDEVKSYQWNFGDGFTSTRQNPEHFYSASGTYRAMLSVITKSGCQDSVEYPIDVIVHKTPDVSITAVDSICAQSPALFSATDKLNESGSRWQWNFADNTTDNNSGQTQHTFVAGGSYLVNVIVTTPGDCADTASRLMNVVALPTVSLGLDSFVCEGSTVMLMPTGADTYNWTNDNTLSCTSCTTPIAAPVSNTSYSVTGTNKFGCKAADTIAIEVVKPQTITVTNDTLCLGEKITLQASGADLYSWSPAIYLSSTTSANPQFQAAKDTTIVYSVTGTDRKKCFSDTKTLAVKVYPIPHIEIAQKDIDLNVGLSVPLTTKSSADVTQWRWEPQNFLSDARVQSPVASPTQTITYNCVATNGGSCFARDQVTVHVMCNGANLFVPNTFSPNHNGVNDKFFPHGTGVFNIKSLRIFNRWGQVVYEKNNFLPNVESDGWDGSFKGQPLESDVYVYMLEIICENNSVIPFKGNVTLLR